MTFSVTRSPERTIWRAALAWVASASSSKGGAKSEAKKIASQRDKIVTIAIGRRGPLESSGGEDGVETKGAERVGVVMAKVASIRINGCSEKPGILRPHCRSWANSGEGRVIRDSEMYLACGGCFFGLFEDEVQCRRLLQWILGLTPVG